jgi:hypothetical protein
MCNISEYYFPLLRGTNVKKRSHICLEAAQDVFNYWPISHSLFTIQPVNWMERTELQESGSKPLSTTKKRVSSETTGQVPFQF